LSVAANIGRYQAMTASTPAVATATAYYKANIGSVTTAAQLVNNPKLFAYAMTAFGLSDMTYAKSLMQQVLQQGTTSSAALANTLNNPNILAFAKAFDFKSNGAATTRSASATTDVVNSYVMQTLETNEGQKNPGVQLALYFQQNASKIANGYDILADKKLLTVAQTALGISSYTSMENIDAQANQLNKLLNYGDFQSPAKIKQFAERFAAQYDAQNQSSSTSSSYSLGMASGAATGLGANLLLSLQGVRFGGA
jgi:hypothetical protein